MFQRPQTTITVTGASVEENQQITQLIHECLVEKGFTNVTANHAAPSYSDVSVYEMIRSMNPDLMDTPVQIVHEADDDYATPSMGSMQHSMSRHQPHWYS